jgi:hypothetical protein
VVPPPNVAGVKAEPPGDAIEGISSDHPINRWRLVIAGGTGTLAGQISGRGRHNGSALLDGCRLLRGAAGK